MKWINNGDPPIYVWKGDFWYNQKDKLFYFADLEKKCWVDAYTKTGQIDKVIYFSKKTIIMDERTHNGKNTRKNT